MKRKLTGLSAVAVLAVGVAIPVTANGATELSAHLTGKEIVNPNGGDPNGRANIELRVNRVKRRVCYVLTFKRLDEVTGGFIHRGEAGEIARPIITLFEGDVSSPHQGCVKGLKKRFVKRLKRKPELHYVDLTTRDYPDGAVRGQLEK